jgi:hypothetical protein
MSIAGIKNQTSGGQLGERRQAEHREGHGDLEVMGSDYDGDMPVHNFVCNPQACARTKEPLSCVITLKITLFKKLTWFKLGFYPKIRRSVTCN